jgi:hypothetical protein
MFYKIMNSRKLRFQRVILIYFLIYSYLTTFGSCMTTETSYISPDSLNSKSVKEIRKIELNNGTSIDCEGKIIKIEKESDSTLFFAISTYTIGDNYKTDWTKKLISAKDILKIQLEKSVVNKDATIGVVIVGGLILAGLIILGIAMRDMPHFRHPR